MTSTPATLASFPTTGYNEYVANAGASSVSVYMIDPFAPGRVLCGCDDVGGGGTSISTPALAAAAAADVDDDDDEVHRRFGTTRAGFAVRTRERMMLLRLRLATKEPPAVIADVNARLDRNMAVKP
jgi:hypothetical protein